MSVTWSLGQTRDRSESVLPYGGLLLPKEEQHHERKIHGSFDHRRTRRGGLSNFYREIVVSRRAAEDFIVLG